MLSVWLLKARPSRGSGAKVSEELRDRPQDVEHGPEEPKEEASGSAGFGRSDSKNGMRPTNDTTGEGDGFDDDALPAAALRRSASTPK